MKRALHFLLLAGSLALIGPADSFSQTWSTGSFNTNSGWVRNVSIIGQNTNDAPGDRWTGNDIYDPVTDLGETDTILRIGGYTPGSSALGNSSLVQGGLYSAEGIFPGTNNVRLWRSFSPIATSQSDTVVFFAEWSLIGSLDGSFPELDSFAFDLRNTSNTSSLLRLDLAPGINLLPNAYTLQSTVDSGSGPVTDTLIDLGYQAIFQVVVEITGTSYNLNLSQINPSTRTNIVSYALVSGASLSEGLSAENFGVVSLDWVLTSGDPENPGSNYIIVNEVSVVPEPSTLGLVAAAGLLLSLVARLRRRA